MVFTFFIAILAFVPHPVRSQVVVIEAIATATKKVIRAVDLQIQRLQNRTIDLQNIQKQIENTLSKLRLQEIAEWTNQQKELYRQYFDELWRVKTAIVYYKRITEIVAMQKQLVDQYKRAYSLVRQDKHFSAKELEYISSVYTGIIEASLSSIEQIFLVIQSFSVQMSDAARLQIINQAADQIEQHISDLTTFTNQNILISQQRAKNLSDLTTIKQLYGLPN